MPDRLFWISVKTTADVTQAFAFSGCTDVPLSIKNTGHDFAGKSMAPGTPSLWTHNTKYINHNRPFVPDKCSVQGVLALTCCAGQDMESVFLFAETNNITFVGGSAKTVGAAGGWVMNDLLSLYKRGGGHSILSNTYGLGVDRILQFRIVRPTAGHHRQRLPEHRPTLGVLRRWGVPTVNLFCQLEPASNVQSLAKLVGNSLQWSKDGWGGYVYATSSILANPKLNATAAAASLKPLTKFIKGSQSFTPQKSAALLNTTLQTFTLSGGHVGFFLTTPFSYQSPPNVASATPAWRGTVWHTVTDVMWSWDASVDTAKKGYTDLYNALRALTPQGGAYLNEANVYEPNASTSFWGLDKYAKLW
ncbi:hypothetical protein FRC08_014956 [Ceratobasidium sp. 394]|nr:hypothetical protein FRC08_014956 [Ceratobasidium sp. 394]